MKNIEGADNFQAWKYRISLVLEENELDSYINEEVPVWEEDEAKALHKKKLVMAKRIIADLIKDHLIPIEECEDPECGDHIIILHKGLLDQRTTWSSGRRSGECRDCNDHLEWSP